MRWLFAGMSLIVAALAPLDAAPVAEVAGTTGRTVRIALVGDVMVGRGVESVITREPDAVFAGVRHVLAGADIAAANLESPLTDRAPVDPDRHDLRAGPGAARVLAASGFDVLALANNHAADAGPLGVTDTRVAIVEAGMVAVGAGPSPAAALEPAVVEVGGLTVGFLAFDATGAGMVDGGAVSSWHRIAGAAAIRGLADRVDVLVVGVHGGSEYLSAVDPFVSQLASAIIGAGADVVWGHGAHVVQPITASVGAEGTAVVATSLGNFLFDQFGADRTTGVILEVLADGDGVVAYRVADTRHPDRRVELVDWRTPTGDAVWHRGSWWSIVRPPARASETSVTLHDFPHELVAAAAGDLTGDGRLETVVAFRRAYTPTAFSALRPERRWFDELGRSAHLGVYRGPDLEEVWVAGTVLHPIGGLEVCDGSLSLLHTGLDHPAPQGVSAWRWNGFGFDTSSFLPDHRSIGCADIDGDGRTEPLALAP